MALFDRSLEHLELLGIALAGVDPLICTAQAVQFFAELRRCQTVVRRSLLQSPRDFLEFVM